MKKISKKAKKNAKAMKKVRKRTTLPRSFDTETFSFEGMKFKTLPGVTRPEMPEDAAVAASMERTKNAWKSKLSAQLITELTALASKHFTSVEEKRLNAEVWQLRMDLSNVRREHHKELHAIHTALQVQPESVIGFATTSQILQTIHDLLNPIVIVSGSTDAVFPYENLRIIQTAEDAKKDIGTESVDIWAPVDVGGPEIAPEDIGTRVRADVRVVTSPDLYDPWFKSEGNK